ncbi:MAG: hypothetical protein K5657_01300 [Desulfovibrio sp.]|nr:hypothetical protein [Desulfovibrio sp.]
MTSEDSVEKTTDRTGTDAGVTNDTNTGTKAKTKRFSFFSRKKPESSTGSEPPAEENRQNAPDTAGETGERTSEAPHSLLERISFQGFLLLLVVLAVQAAPDIYYALNGTSLYCPAEVNHIGAYLHAETKNLWLAPVGVLPAEWPGLMWATKLVSFLVPQGDLLFATTGILAVALCLFAAWNLGRVAYGYAEATAAGCILLAAPLFTPLSHVYGAAALATGLYLFALTLLCRGWIKEGGWFSLPLGFLFIGLATLTGGLFFLVLPLLSSFFFLLWSLRYKRAQRSDSIFGFLCLLILLGAWFFAMYIVVGDAAYMESLLAGAVKNPWPLTDWIRPLLLLTLGVFPWVLAWIFPSWTTLCRNALTSLRASQNTKAITSLIWINAFTGILLLFCLPAAAQHTATICLVTLLAVLLGKTVVRLSKLGARLFIGCCMLFLLLAGLVLLGSYFSLWESNLATALPVLPPKDILAVLPTLVALPVLGAICLLGTFFCKRCLGSADTGRFLLFSLAIATLLTLASTILLVPALADKPFAKLATLGDITKKPSVKTEVPAPGASTTNKEEEKTPLPLPAATHNDAPAKESVEKPASTPDPQTDKAPATDSGSTKEKAGEKEAQQNTKEEKSNAEPEKPVTDAPKSEEAKKDAVTPEEKSTEKNAVTPEPVGNGKTGDSPEGVGTNKNPKSEASGSSTTGEETKQESPAQKDSGVKEQHEAVPNEKEVLQKAPSPQPENEQPSFGSSS